MKLSIAPVPYNWEQPALEEFYTQLAWLPVDIVYLGETVCSKRRALNTADWLRIADQLQASGKQVVLSTLTLIEAESELASLRRLITGHDYLVEANDVAAVQLLADQRPFVIGPHINVYNHHSLALLERGGASRWVIPAELDKHALADILARRPAELETELFCFGRLPLAYSARCFTARAHNRAKDECDFVCGDYADGMTLYTQDRQAFLVLNGIQIQSAATQNLAAAWEEIAALGIDILRLAPQVHGMPEIISIFRRLLDGGMSPLAAAQQLRGYQASGGCNGYWEHQPGMAWNSGIEA